MITFNNLGRYGRLGNQMFQYAFLYSLSKKLKVDFGVPYKNKSQDEFKHFSLPDGFKITALDSSEIINKNNYAQEFFNFYPEVFEKIKNNTDVRGFFQSEKYFKDFDLEIKKEFEFKDEITEKAEKEIGKHKEPLISICIRRGNYLQDKYRKIHPVCKINYFLNCLSKIPNYKKIIFTDDPSWHFINKIKNYEVFKQEDSIQNKFVVMKIMSMCDYQIISNSSFCWWSAWLGNSKRIFAPKIWFSRKWFDFWKDKNWSDIYCSNWEILDSPIAL